MQHLSVTRLDGRKEIVSVADFHDPNSEFNRRPEPAADAALASAIDAIHSVYWAAVETTKQCNRGKGTISKAHAKREERAVVEAVELIVRRKLTEDERRAVLERIDG